MSLEADEIDIKEFIKEFGRDVLFEFSEYCKHKFTYTCAEFKSHGYYLEIGAMEGDIYRCDLHRLMEIGKIHDEISDVLLYYDVQSDFKNFWRNKK